MLSFRIEKLGDVAIIHCAGRIVFPYAHDLRTPLLRQLQARTLIVDLVDAIAIDASGLGLLVSLRTWAKERGREIKLMNVTPRVEQLLQLTKLKSEFEICSVREILDLLCRGIHLSVSAITTFEDADETRPLAYHAKWRRQQKSNGRLINREVLIYVDWYHNPDRDPPRARHFDTRKGRAGLS